MWGEGIIILVLASLYLPIVVCASYAVVVSRLLNLTCDRVDCTPEVRKYSVVPTTESGNTVGKVGFELDLEEQVRWRENSGDEKGGNSGKCNKRKVGYSWFKGNAMRAG